MKIIKPGRVRDEWPVGVPLRCNRCGCEFQLERNDMMLNWNMGKVIVAVDESENPICAPAVSGTCPQPGCGNQCTIQKETPRSEAYSAS